MIRSQIPASDHDEVNLGAVRMPCERCEEATRDPGAGPVNPRPSPPLVVIAMIQTLGRADVPATKGLLQECNPFSLASGVEVWAVPLILALFSRSWLLRHATSPMDWDRETGQWPVLPLCIGTLVESAEPCKGTRW